MCRSFVSRSTEAHDAERRQRFERETKVISNLNHPNICTLCDVGQPDGLDFIVMEFLEGDSPAQRARGILVTDDLQSYDCTAYYQVSSLFISENKQ
jgi:serine/threonine protein kinase